MTCFGWARRCAIGVVLCVSLSGCLPPSDTSDETKEPHFITGKNLIEQMDWQGAVDEFEKSLEVNPRSSSAHFELGWLNEDKLNPPDFAAAVYHYEKYLNLSSSQDKADLVRQQINNCKMEMLKTMSAGPLPSGTQREMDRLIADNKSLQSQVAQLQAQITQMKAAAAVPIARPVKVDDGSNPPPTHMVVSKKAIESPKTNIVHASTGSAVPTRISNTSSVKTHVVKSHETMAAIARQYGISLAALEEANPQVRPSHLLVGQSLKVPAP